MWDQIQCYGYNRRDDGKVEVFHRGESFHGPLPVRLLVQLHARYVIWATSKHINSPAFGSGDLEVQEHQRANVPLHVLGEFVNRLIVAQRVAIESGRLAAGADTDKAEETLRALKRLREHPTAAYVQTSGRLQRSVSRLEVADPKSQAAIDAVLANMSQTRKGQAAAVKAIEELISHPEIEVQEPRYGGAFKARMPKSDTVQRLVA